MEPVKGHQSNVDPKAKALREMVAQSSSVIAHYWPMRSFVHHNPLRTLETFHFEEAVRMGKRFVGGDGYLSNETYRQFVQSGRIKPAHVDAALRPLGEREDAPLGSQAVSHVDVLRAHLLNGITAPADETVAALIDRSPYRDTILSLGERVTPKNRSQDQVRAIGRYMTLVTWCDRTFHMQLGWVIDRELIKWCEAFLDEEHAAWSMPERTSGFYLAWRSLASKEWSPCGIANSSAKIAALPASADEALLEHLDALGIPQEVRQDYLSHELTALCGWASFINWREEHGDYEWQAAHPIDLVQYLAVRLFYERELIEQACRSELGIEGTFGAISAHVQNQQEAAESNPNQTGRLAAAWQLTRLAESLQLPASAITEAEPEALQVLLDWLDAFPETDHGPVWLKALEAGYHEDLIGKLRAGASTPATADDGRPLTQSMYCIDVRSEPFRRNLESVGNHETIGFAGFFAIALRNRALGHHHETEQYPVIVAAKHTVHEVPRPNQDERVARHDKGEFFLHTLHEMLHDLKTHVLTPYITVESIGWIFGAPLIGRTIFPATYRRWRTRARKAIAPPVSTAMMADKADSDLGMTPEEQATTIEMALRTMGLTKNFARLVLVCGHTSVTDNNPYESALDCGACGGNPGKPNARVFAGIANNPHVRAHLAKTGIPVPEDTVFIAGQHDTTTDIVEIFDLEDIPETHRDDLARFRVDLQKTKIKTNQERCIRLPGVDDHPSASLVNREIERRAGDWSDTRPEWGLSGNAAFIIGSRKLTKASNLGGRTFLNSHDYKVDPTGALLEGILDGPMVVGQWINAEHYFSATDPEVYGSGSKIYHNVVGRIGIMSGPQSDLRTGLAWQSVMSGSMPYHEPVRLIVVIEAPRDRILAIVRRKPTLSQLCDNEWIHLVAIDREGDSLLYRYKPRQGWTSIPVDLSVDGLHVGHGQ